MSDELDIINYVIEEHRKIRQYLKLAGDSTSDREAMASLQKARTDWVPGRLEILVEKQKKIQQTISSLDEGLIHHFNYEEKNLPPILGELLTQTLIIEHRDIRKELDNLKNVVSETRLEGLDREQCLIEESRLHDFISNLEQRIDDHAHREEIILDMLQRALQEKEDR